MYIIYIYYIYIYIDIDIYTYVIPKHVCMYICDAQVARGGVLNLGISTPAAIGLGVAGVTIPLVGRKLWPMIQVQPCAWSACIECMWTVHA